MCKNACCYVEYSIYRDKIWQTKELEQSKLLYMTAKAVIVVLSHIAQSTSSQSLSLTDIKKSSLHSLKHFWLSFFLVCKTFFHLMLLLSLLHLLISFLHLSPQTTKKRPL